MPMPKPNRAQRLADWAVGLFSPRRAAWRGHFRRMETDPDYRDTILAAMHARGYRAAKTSGKQTPWLGTNRSADAEILTDLSSLYSKSRELNRDDPIASGLTDTFVNNVIGTGMRPQARTGDEKKNARIEAVWRERQHNLAPADDVIQGSLQAMWFRKVLEDGGTLIKRAKRTPIDLIWFETVEKDRLVTPTGAQPETKGGEIRDGVEKDASGVPVAYWISKAHPGDSVAAMVANIDQFQRVPASECRYLRRPERPGQTHGVPAFHAILQDLRDLDLLLLASLKRTQIGACLAAFIKSPMAVPSILDVTAKKYGYQLDQSIEPGMLFKLDKQEEIETLIPNFPQPELVPFVITLARRIGAALGVSWQIVLKDFSEANYSSARTDLLEARYAYVVYQSWFIAKALDWVWISVMEDARLRGDGRLRGVTADEVRQVHWIPNGWRWIDPQKDALATRIELQLGITTLRDVCAAQGRDWEEVQEQRLREKQREQDLRKELGLPEVDPAPPKPAARLLAEGDDGSDDRPPRHNRLAGLLGVKR